MNLERPEQEKTDKSSEILKEKAEFIKSQTKQSQRKSSHHLKKNESEDSTTQEEREGTRKDFDPDRAAKKFKTRIFEPQEEDYERDQEREIRPYTQSRKVSEREDYDDYERSRPAKKQKTDSNSEDSLFSNISKTLTSGVAYIVLSVSLVFFRNFAANLWIKHNQGSNQLSGSQIQNTMVPNVNNGNTVANNMHRSSAVIPKSQGTIDLWK